MPAAVQGARIAVLPADSPVETVLHPVEPVPEAPADEADDGDDGSGAFAERVAALTTLADAAERANTYTIKSKSQATITAYASGWRDFLNFCEQRVPSGAPPL